MDPIFNKGWMIDLETASDTKRAAIMSIGAVLYDINEPDYTQWHTYYANVDLNSSIKAGFEVKGSTIYWWFEQSDEARRALVNPKPKPIQTVLKEFAHEYYSNLGLSKFTPVWSYPTSFDMAILGDAYSIVSTQGRPPWNRRYEQCWRTISNFHREPDDPPYVRPNVGEAHNALADALAQAIALVDWIKSR